MIFRVIKKSGLISLPFCHKARVSQTDGQTDRILIARPHLHSMQRGKNQLPVWNRFTGLPVTVLTSLVCSWHVDVCSVVIQLCPCRCSKPSSSWDAAQWDAAQPVHMIRVLLDALDGNKTAPEPLFTGSPALPPDAVPGCVVLTGRPVVRSTSPGRHHCRTAPLSLRLLCCGSCFIWWYFCLYVLPPSGSTSSFSYSILVPSFHHTPRLVRLLYTVRTLTDYYFLYELCFLLLYCLYCIAASGFLSKLIPFYSPCDYLSIRGQMA